MEIKDKLQKSALPKDRIKECMQKSGKKQIDVANESGISKGTISKYISGDVKPKVEAVNKLAQVFGVSSLWLSGYDVPMGISKNHFGCEENPRTLELCDYFETLLPEDQEEILNYVKAYSNGALKANSPGAQEMTEGEKGAWELFRRVPKEKQDLVLSIIRVVLEQK